MGGGTEKRECGGREEDMIGQESKKNENQPMRCNAVARDVLRSLEMEKRVLIFLAKQAAWELHAQIATWALQGIKMHKTNLIHKEVY